MTSQKANANPSFQLFVTKYILSDQYPSKDDVADFFQNHEKAGKQIYFRWEARATSCVCVTSGESRNFLVFLQVLVAPDEAFVLIVLQEAETEDS